LQAGILKAVGNASERLREDALRILRALRFAATLDLQIEDGLAAALHNERELLRKISGERIKTELMGLLPGNSVFTVLMQYANVLAVAIPEIAPAIGFDQRNRHHIYDVWEHTVRAIIAAPTDALLRLALLFHDLGKPAAFSIDERGEGHFYGHPEISAQIAQTRLEALRFSRQTIKAVWELVYYHDAPLKPENLPRLLNKLGEQRVRQLLQIRRADQFAHRPKNRERWLAEVAQTTEALNVYLASQPCFSQKNLAVNGKDLTAIGFTQGKELGDMLKWLLSQVIDGKLANQRELLIKTAIANLPAAKQGKGSAD
jgi:tRNA nucleotidyltransferase (CCA-adding enzyme)